MLILRLLIYLGILAFCLYEILFGLRVMRKKEYIGRRSINLLKSDEYRLTGKAAHTFGLSYVVGCGTIVFAYIVIIPIAFLSKTDTAAIFFAIAFLLGILILIMGNLLAWIQSK